MSQLSTYTKAGLVFAIVIVAAVFGAIGGAAYQSQLAPSTNQGVGTQAIQSGLWLVTMNDTTAIRAFDTTYRNVQNNGGQAMIVQIYANMSDSGSGLIAHVATSTAAILWANTTVGVLTFDGASGDNVTMELAFYVPWRFYYCVNTTYLGSAAPTEVSLVKWFESIPPTGFGFIIQALPLLRRVF